MKELPEAAKHPYTFGWHAVVSKFKPNVSALWPADVKVEAPKKDASKKEDQKKDAPKKESSKKDAPKK